MSNISIFTNIYKLTMQNPVLKPGQHILQMELEMHSIPRSDKAY